MAKRFMYVCVGLLALTSAYLIGARHAGGSIVEHSFTGIIAHSGQWVLMDNGEVWRCQDDPFGTWDRYPQLDPPVEVSQIKFWWPTAVVTYSNEVWFYFETHGGWTNFGTPGGDVARQPTTWSRVKARFGD